MYLPVQQIWFHQECNSAFCTFGTRISGGNFPEKWIGHRGIIDHIIYRNQLNSICEKQLNFGKWRGIQVLFTMSRKN